MNLSFLKSIGGPTVQRGLLKVSKYAPEILTAVGITGIVGSSILVARASMKLERLNEDKNDKVLEVRQYKDEIEGYEENHYRKDLTKVYAEWTLELIKLYGPAVALEVGSLISILAAHGIMKRRLVTLLGAYHALEASFMAYRARVIEEFGEDKDRDFRLGFRTEKIEDPLTGKKSIARRFDPNHVSQYAKFFDEGNINYRDDAEYNLLFLKNAQNWANNRLQLQGYLFLSDVYDMIGIDRTKQSMAVGWVMDPKYGGDLHIDFNIYNADAERARDFVNGLEKAILLDFNVDGVILDLI